MLVSFTSLQTVQYMLLLNETISSIRQSLEAASHKSHMEH